MQQLHSPLNGKKAMRFSYFLKLILILTFFVHFCWTERLSASAIEMDDSIPQMILSGLVDFLEDPKASLTTQDILLASNQSQFKRTYVAFPRIIEA